jgi:hypothetical protein
MKRSHIFTTIFLLTILTNISGCVTTPTFPHQSTIPIGKPTAIDGLWQLHGDYEYKPIFRIKKGVMFAYSNIHPRSFVKQGWVIAKGIKLRQFPKFSVMPITYMGATWDYGQGEIEVLSRDLIILRYFPNPRTRFNRTIEETYKNISLDNSSLLASRFSFHSPPDKLPDIASVDQKPKANSTSFRVTEGNRFAVIIGVSDYQDTRIPSLRYASKDAQAFYDWLISPEGGKYSPSHVKLLLDQDANGKNIKSALYEWLKQALEEDMVIIYFAGHGSPESVDSPENLFLLPYDANYAAIASTGFPMWDIETALKRFIKAKKVVVIADACHAGGVGQSFDVARRANRGIKVNPINSGLQSLSKVADGIAIISASADNQYSQESRNWGGGHGVFTYFLLKGVKGDADFNRDKIVNLGELNLYLSEQVRRATKNAQSPIVSGKFDPALTIEKR